MKKVLILVGTRPNFIKVTQFKKTAEQFENLEIKVVHTGQHYDQKMSGIFFDQFELKPDFFLDASAASSASQFASIIEKLSELLKTYKPDLLVVPGDVNSTLAGALTAKLEGVKIAHLESGLRSFDREMPEEINRILTDEISDYYFITEDEGLENLEREQKAGKAYFVGNTMIDTLVAFQEKIDASEILKNNKISAQSYFLMTMHRPSNVDHKKGLEQITTLISTLATQKTVVIPLHPRTKNRLDQFGLLAEFMSIKNCIFLEPLGYFEFQKLIKNAYCIVTDSGGIQEESTYYKVPCLTYRENTERPITITVGSNTLTPKVDQILQQVQALSEGSYKKGAIPKLWDGKATQRIVEIIDQQILA